MYVPGRPSPAHMAHGGDPPRVGKGGPGHDTKRYHRHKRHRPIRDPVEGGVGDD